MNTKYKQFVDKFSQQRVLVVGDMLADEYILGRTARVSREAPVMILKFDSQEIRPGGAANTVNNIRSLGGQVFPLGIVGDDESGRQLLLKMKQLGICSNCIHVHTGHPTTTKTRILAYGHHTTRQQVIRIDKEYGGNTGREVEETLLTQFWHMADKVDAMVVSDYGYGVLSLKLIEAVNRVAAEGKKVVAVDSRYDLLKFKRPTIISPNETEAEEVLKVQIYDDESVQQAIPKLWEKIQSRGVIITRGRQGMAVGEPDFTGNKIKFIPVHGTDEVADVTGAGDTVISALTLALSAGASLEEAARLANCAAGIVVMKSGTATVERGELLRELENLRMS